MIEEIKRLDPKEQLDVIRFAYQLDAERRLTGKELSSLAEAWSTPLILQKKRGSANRSAAASTASAKMPKIWMIRDRRAREKTEKTLAGMELRDTHNGKVWRVAVEQDGKRASFKFNIRDFPMPCSARLGTAARCHSGRPFN